MFAPEHPYLAFHGPECPGVGCKTWEEAHALVAKWRKEGMTEARQGTPEHPKPGMHVLY